MSTLDQLSEGTRFIEDFQSVHQYQPSATMDPQAKNTPTETPKRSGTLRKKDPVKEFSSEKTKVGSIRSIQLESESRNSVFYSLVPTQSNPTEILVNRFQAWRKLLKDFISYFREVQVQYEARARGIHKITQNLNSAVHSSDFLGSGGILETNSILCDFHKEANVNSENAAMIEIEVINNLTGLRSDLNLKIKEIKALSGDFKNNVDREKESTKKEIQKLQQALETFDSNPLGGKDPYIIKLGLESQLKRHITEENYLHRAYLNLESSGRELEKIVVDEIQKAYSTYVKILVQDGQELLGFADRLTTSTLRLPKDYEWSAFVEREPNMVDPGVPMRTLEEIEYPGHQHPAVTEIRCGMLERKSKYLKSFTPAWYVLSPTHLHEFKSPDRTCDLTPVMSLYLPESSLGKHSNSAAVSHKFVLKAKQTGSLHRGHSWVFRAESHQAMLGWYEEIKKLTEISGAERNAYVQETVSHKRTASISSHRAESYVSDNGLDNDEADEIPYSDQPSAAEIYGEEPGLQLPRRPEGGRFPSKIQLERGLEHQSISGDSSASAVASTFALPGGCFPDHQDKIQTNETFRGSAYMKGTSPETQDGGHSCAVVPPMNRRRSDSPSSWSSNGKYPAHEVLKNEAAYSPMFPGQQGEQFAGFKPSRIPLITGYGIDSTTGESESQAVFNNMPSQTTDEHIAFIGGAPVKSVSNLDPREPIPHEINLVAMDAVPMDSVAVAPPTGEALPHQYLSKVDIERSWPGLSNVATVNSIADYAVRKSDKPISLRGSSTNTISKGTISDLHVPGEYPKKTS